MGGSTGGWDERDGKQELQPPDSRTEHASWPAARRMASRPKKCFISYLFYSRIRVTEIGTRLDSLPLIRIRSLSRVETPEQVTFRPRRSQRRQRLIKRPANTGTWMRDCSFPCWFHSSSSCCVSAVQGGRRQHGAGPGRPGSASSSTQTVYRWKALSAATLWCSVPARYPQELYQARRRSSGDHVHIAYGHVFVNEEQLLEAYVPSDYLDARSYSDIWFRSNCYFVLAIIAPCPMDSRGFWASDAQLTSMAKLSSATGPWRSLGICTDTPCLRSYRSR